MTISEPFRALFFTHYKPSFYYRLEWGTRRPCALDHPYS